MSTHTDPVDIGAYQRRCTVMATSLPPRPCKLAFGHMGPCEFVPEEQGKLPRPYPLERIHTEAELHKLLDSIVDGQIITASWCFDGDHAVTTTGPAQVDCAHVSCYPILRGYDRKINPYLTSVEVTTKQATTVTRDDPDTLKLIESLTEGQMVTAEWRDGERSMTITGPVSRDYYGHARVKDPWGFTDFRIAAGGVPHSSLQSVTVTRPTTVRWERKP